MALFQRACLVPILKKILQAGKKKWQSIKLKTIVFKFILIREPLKNL